LPLVVIWCNCTHIEFRKAFQFDGLSWGLHGYCWISRIRSRSLVWGQNNHKVATLDRAGLYTFAGRVFSGARDLFRLLSFAEVSKIKSFKSLLGWQ
jgi:hypothetical protein